MARDLRRQFFITAAALLAAMVVELLAMLPANAQEKVSNDFLVTRVRLFDGAQSLQNVQVAVTGGIIRAIGDNLPAWRHLPVVDGSGATLVPGLIDSHVHVRDDRDLRQA